MVKGPRKTGFKELSEIALQFETSLLATALRLVKVDTLPVMLACYGQGGHRWHIAAPHVPRRWWLKSSLDEDSFAFDLMTKGTPCPALRKQSADTWFDNDDAEEFEYWSSAPSRRMATSWCSSTLPTPRCSNGALTPRLVTDGTTRSVLTFRPPESLIRAEPEHRDSTRAKSAK